MDATAAAGSRFAALSRFPRVLSRVGFATLVGALGLVTAAAVILTDGNLAVTVTPVVLASAIYAVVTIPLRYTAAALVFVLLALDNFSTALGLWHTPWAIVNELVINNLDRTIPAARGFKLAGMELLGVLVLGVVAHRRASGATIDVRGKVPTASLVPHLALVYLLAIAYAVANGFLHRGSTEIMIWQARPLLQMLMLFFIFDQAFRGPLDHRPLAQIIVLSALAKAILAIFVYYKFEAQGDPLACATNHGDSILFTVACMILVAHLMERTDRRRLASCALILPLLLWGMQVNGRRLVWVQLAFALLATYLMSPWRPWKRAFTRAALVTAPIALLYLSVGWNSGSKVFAPVQVARSVIDTKADRSTFFRHVENWNLVMGMRYWPVLGRGFGHEFIEYYPNDNIVSLFPQYRAEPHNQVLGTLFFAGLIGFTGLWMLPAAGVFLAARSYRRAQVPEHRAAALCCYATILVGFIDTYGDLGLRNIQNKVLTALALAFVGKLAVASGAWPRRESRRPIATARSEA